MDKHTSEATVFGADSVKEASLDEAVDKLKALYLEKNGKDATQSEITQWRSVLAESESEEDAPTV